jgi:hypothetical protein
LKAGITKLLAWFGEGLDRCYPMGGMLHQHIDASWWCMEFGAYQ